MNKTSLWMDIGKFGLVVAALTWLGWRGTTKLGYNWEWDRVPDYFIRVIDGAHYAGPLLQGLVITLKITAVSLILSFVIGLVTALLRMSNSFTGRALARLYMELIRNTPLLIQLFFVYFVLGPVIGLERFTSAVLALSLFEGAYASEILRAGIVSIHKGQWEASHALGLSSLDMYRFVILPQAVRRVLPPLTSQAISLVKDSALVSTIAIYDLSMQAQAIIAETFLTFEIWFAVAGVYLVLTVILSIVVGYMEKKFQAA